MIENEYIYFIISETFPARPPNFNNIPNPGLGDPADSGINEEIKDIIAL